MKKAIYLLTLLVITFSACKKYEDGPGLSLRTKKARLAGDWTLSKLNIVETEIESDGDEIVTTTETNDGSKVTVTEVFKADGSASSTNSNQGTIAMKLTIEKDGTYSSETETVFTYTYTIMSVAYTEQETKTVTETGYWNFLNGVGDAKKKEQMVFKPSTRTTSTSSVITSPGIPTNNTSNTVTNTLAGEELVYTIALLKNKEIRLKRIETQSSTTTTASASSSNSVTTVTDISFVQ